MTQNYKVQTRRVQVPVYTHAWLAGDQYGEIVKIRETAEWTIAYVKLDKSRRTLQCNLNDCIPVNEGSN